VVFFYKTKNYNHKTVIKTLLTKENSETQIIKKEMAEKIRHFTNKPPKKYNYKNQDFLVFYNVVIIG
jgi:hypothetical protein